MATARAPRLLRISPRTGRAVRVGRRGLGTELLQAGVDTRKLSHRARRRIASPPMKHVERVVTAVGEAVQAWADRFISAVMARVVPDIVQDATVEQVFADLTEPTDVAKRTLDSVFQAVDKASSDDLRVMGVQTSTVVPRAEQMQAEWIRQSTDLIKATEDVRRRVEKIISDPLTQGRSVSDIRKLLEEQAGYARSRAELTARDQTLKLYGKIAEERQTAAGFDKYVWTTSLDERVREDHAKLDGTVQRWNDPPIVDTRTGRREHPGGDYSCRCSAVPYADDGTDTIVQEVPAERAAPEPRPDTEIQRALAQSQAQAAAERVIAEQPPPLPATERVRALRERAPRVEVDKLPLPEQKRLEANQRLANGLHENLTRPQQAAMANFVDEGFRVFRQLQQGASVEQAAKAAFTSVENANRLKAMLPALTEAQTAMQVETPTRFGSLYRGVAVSADDLAAWLETSEVEFRAASNSTSYSARVANGFATQAVKDYSDEDSPLHKVVLKIDKVDRGAAAMYDANDLQNEQEMILGRGRFKVTSTSFDATTETHLIEMVQVGTSRFDEIQPRGERRRPKDFSKYVSDGSDCQLDR